jgi:hypothetical protein
MGRCLEYTALKVDGQWWRAEKYFHPRSGVTEYIVRGPFKNGVFHADGRPVFAKGHHTAWKMHGGKPCSVNTDKSKKNNQGDPSPQMLVRGVWEPFWEAYAMAKGLIA